MSAHGRSTSTSQASVPSAGGSTNPQREATAAPGHMRKDSKAVAQWRKHNRAKSAFPDGITPTYELATFLRGQSEPPTLQEDPANAHRKRQKLSELSKKGPPLDAEGPEVAEDQKKSLHSLTGSLAELSSRREAKRDTSDWTLDDFKVDTVHLLDSAVYLFSKVRKFVLKHVAWYDYSDPLEAIRDMNKAYFDMFTDRVVIAFLENHDRWTPVFLQDLETLHEKMRAGKIPQGGSGTPYLFVS